MIDSIDLDPTLTSRDLGHTVNVEVYCEQLKLCCHALGRCRRLVILLQNNARPQVA